MLKEQYQKHGFVVVQNMIPADKISLFNKVYGDQIVQSANKFYRQNTNRYEINTLNAAGHVEQSFFDILGYQQFPEFKQTALGIFFDPLLMQLLDIVNGHVKHNLMQTALFDANTETAAHQDSWYADSVPHGHMIGAWIALEDIQKEAGRFYVLPGSQKLVFHDDKVSHSDWMLRIAKHVDTHHDEIVVPTLKAGDVMLFNAGIIHGSMPTTDHQYSRKSIVGHYLPKGMTYGNYFTSKPWVQYQRYGEHQYYLKKPDYSLLGSALVGLRAHLHNKPKTMHLIRKLQNKFKIDF